MARRIFGLIFLLTVGNLAHSQDWENLLFIKIGELKEKQEAALSQLKGIQEKLEHVEGKLQEIHEKQEYFEGKLQEIQEKQEHFEGQHQDFCHELGHLKGAVNSNQDLLQRQQELESSLSQEISGVISLLETGGIDECSKGSHNCGDHAACTDKFFKYGCSCLPGFAQDSSHCEDIDECAQGKDKCSPQAICRNSVGSYSCSCNPPFEGDGRSCNCPSGFAQNGSNCGELCRSPAMFFEGLGCLKVVKEFKNFEEMRATCLQAGGRLLQNFSHKILQEVVQAFGPGGWVGVHEGRWMESGGLPLPEELWEEGSPRGSDPSVRKGLCGFIDWDPSSSSYKVSQSDCSIRGYGYCQFVTTPQK